MNSSQRAVLGRKSGRQLAGDGERDVKPCVLLCLEERKRRPWHAAVVLALEVEEERGFEDQRRKPGRKAGPRLSPSEP